MIWRNLTVAFAAFLLASCNAGSASDRVIAVTEQSVLRKAEIKLIPELMRRAGVPYEERVYPWVRAYDEAKHTPGMMIYSMARLPVREEHFEWAVPVIDVQYGLWKLKVRSDIRVTTLADAKRYKIGTHLGGSDDVLLRARGFSEPTLVPEDVREKSIAALLAGRIDLLSGSQLTIKQACNNSPGLCAQLQLVTLTGDRATFWLAFNKSVNPEIVARIRRAHSSMIADGTWDLAIAPFKPVEPTED